MPARFTQDGGSGGIGGAVTSALASVKAAFSFLNRFSLTATENKVAVAIDASRVALQMAQTPALVVSSLGVVGSTDVSNTPAVALSTRISEFHITDIPACDIQQVTYGLFREVGANAQAAVGTAWTNPNNALGIQDAAFATSVGSVGGNTNGIELSYTNSVDKAELVISDVLLAVNFNVQDILNLCTRTVSYNIGAGLVVLDTGTGNQIAQSYALPITTWAEYDALVVRVVTAYAGLSTLSNANIDSIEVQVTATKTDVL